MKLKKEGKDMVLIDRNVTLEADGYMTLGEYLGEGVLRTFRLDKEFWLGPDLADYLQQSVIYRGLNDKEVVICNGSLYTREQGKKLMHTGIQFGGYSERPKRYVKQ